MGKRKDSKGRVLKDGESQRQNGSYCFRYTGCNGKRRTVYSKTLDDLRKKEANIQRDLLDGIDSEAGEITVSELVDRSINLRRSKLKQNSLRAYSSAINRIHADPFGQRKIKSVKISDAKSWFIALHESGMKRNSISILQNVIRPAFEMAVDDDAIRKNPFKFKLCDILDNDTCKRKALTKKQQEQYLTFIQEQGNGTYSDDIEILMQTGLRVSELYGLTKADIDLDKRRIYVNKQLCRTGDKPYFITTPKTESGIRCIPMSDRAYMAFRRVWQNRISPKVEMMVDGHAGFLFLDKAGKPKVAMHLENYMRGMQKKFSAQYPGTAPKVTPHVLRHTFCTNMAEAYMDPKALQRMMGHSDINVTYNVYTDMSDEAVERSFQEACKRICLG